MDMEKLLQRYESYWNHENGDRPIVNMTTNASRIPVELDENHKTYRDAWLDTEYVIKKAREVIESTVYLGEGYPAFNPNLGPDLIGAVCGSELEFGEITSWSKPCVDSYETFGEIKFDENNPYWKKICEITNAALEDSKGDYVVGITDLHPGADAVVALRGAETSAFDIYDYPDEFKKMVWDILPVFKEMTSRLHGMISKKQKMSSCWMGIIHPTELWYPTSCDFSCMISPDDYKEFILPELIEEIKWLPNSVYHLDGPDALRHLDTILSIKELKGVQWVYGAGQPSAKHWIDVLKKIQDAGKCVQVSCTTDDLLPLCEALDPRGVHLRCGVPDKESGEHLLKEMERICREKRAHFSFIE